jgi:hypothetical protein
MENIMTDSYNYSLVKNDQGTYAIRSSVKSFNLDHVTDKDIVSFYNNFSQFASFDTGLLPLNGTGVLAIRSAGPHTQVVTQHAPGTYHINWGDHEGDKNAKTYYVAQPYRIVIGDFENGNLLGAKMFYSPYPITSPNNVLYHVNLPNINCKGYRGNAVGWICLYHKDDWSSLPFNEKVSRFIERCSGVETYNDANMSETDGPRFYAANGKPEYITNPKLWQQKSDEEGFNWTLDENLWIPVKVKDMDNQAQHDYNGQELTLAMAMLGNYQAYYSDTNIPKMYNIISRPDLSFTDVNIADMFKKAFASSPVNYTHEAKDNPYDFTVANREKNGSAVLIQPNLFSNNDEEDDENDWTCICCQDNYTSDDDEPIGDINGNDVCNSCINDYYVFIESVDGYYHKEDDSIVYSEFDCEYYHKVKDTVAHCHTCSNWVGVNGHSENSKSILFKQLLHLPGSEEVICSDCQPHFIADNELTPTNCYVCQAVAIKTHGWGESYPQSKAMVVTPDLTLAPKVITLCQPCNAQHFTCPCGLLKNNNDQFGSCTPTILPEDTSITVTQCCAECLGNITEDSDTGQMVAYYQPFQEDYVKVAIKEAVHTFSKSVGTHKQSNNAHSTDPF